jgi:hypothetical protein
VVKQADLVLALFTCGDYFDAEQKARDFDYYERITVRDSSLSAAIQGVVAAEVGHLDLAYDYLGETAFIDLRDLAFNTRDGLHLASLAGTWLVVVAGFGGLRDTGETLRLDPRLPSRLPRISFRLIYRKRRLQVEVRAGETRHAVRGLPGDPGRHRTGVGVDAPVSQQIQLRVEQLPIQSFDRQSFLTAPSDDVQHRLGALHYAYLPALDLVTTCAPSPCSRLSRPPRQVVTPATTTGTPSP